jgi:twitching motility protein PilT
MSLVESLLGAIARLDGDALVMHVGEKPYVVTTSEATNAYRGPICWGQVELSSRTLTLDAVLGMVGELLPPDEQRQLADIGAIECELPPNPAVPGQFVVIAARGGDDVWLEIRLRRPEPAVEMSVVLRAEPSAGPPGGKTPDARGSAPAPSPEAPEPRTLAAVPAGPRRVDETPPPTEPPSGDLSLEASPSSVGPVEPEPSAGPGFEAAEPDLFVIDDEQDSGTAVDQETEDTAHEVEMELDLESHAVPTSAAGDTPLPEPAEAPEIDEVYDLSGLSVESLTEAPLDVLMGTDDDNGPGAAEAVAPVDALDAPPTPAEAEPPQGEKPTEASPPSDGANEGPAGLEKAATPAGQPEPEPQAEIGLATDAGLPVTESGPEATAQVPAAEEPVAPAAEEAALAEVARAGPASPDAPVAPIEEPAEVPVPGAGTEDRAAELEAVHGIEQADEAQELHAPPESFAEPPPEPEPEAVGPDVAGAEEVAAAPPQSVDAAARPVLERPPAPPPGVPEETIPAAAMEPPADGPAQPTMREEVPVDEVESGVSVEQTVAASVPTPPLTEAVDGAPEEEVVEARTIQGSRLDGLLRRAAARGASALYLVTGLAPVVRVDGAIAPLGGAEGPSADDVRAMMLELAPESLRPALETGAGAEWVSDVADIGRVRCLSFTDHRGPGGIFRMLTAQALTVEQLGLSRELQSLCAESEGLVIVAGPRLSGKSTLLTGLVDLVNRSRADYVITIEGQIQFVHESRRAFVSQREVRGGAEQQAAAVRAALREDPDVIAIDDVRAPETVALALEAAQSGRLVFCSVTAASATAAIERLVSQFPADRRDRVYAALASTLRGVVAQVLLRRLGGGKVAARELLLNTRAIAAVLLERQLVALAPALDQGRSLGMAPLNDALVSLVRAGAVAPADAFRKSPDQDGFLAELQRQAIDTSFVERLA